MTKWNYQFLVVPESEENTYRKLEDDCIALGKQGWELVTITENHNSKALNITYWVFKKPLST